MDVSHYLLYPPLLSQPSKCGLCRCTEGAVLSLSRDHGGGDDGAQERGGELASRRATR